MPLTIANALVTALFADRDLTEIDLQAIEAYSTQLHRMRTAHAILEEEGLIIESLRGPVPHPAAQVEREASAEMRQWITRRPDLFAPAKEEESSNGDTADPDSGLDGGDVLAGL